MMLRRLSIAAVLACMPVFLYVPSPAHAVFEDIKTQNDALASEQGANFDITQDPRIVVARSIRVVVSLLGFGFFFYTIYGGVLILTSQGAEDRIQKGKSSIVTGVIGILVMLSAYAITQFVSNALTRSLQTEPCPFDDPCIGIRPESGITQDPLGDPPDPGTNNTIWDALF